VSGGGADGDLDLQAAGGCGILLAIRRAGRSDGGTDGGGSSLALPESRPAARSPAEMLAAIECAYARRRPGIATVYRGGEAVMQLPAVLRGHRSRIAGHHAEAGRVPPEAHDVEATA
jgi:hypothetical protein